MFWFLPLVKGNVITSISVLNFPMKYIYLYAVLYEYRVKIITCVAKAFDFILAEELRGFSEKNRYHFLCFSPCLPNKLNSTPKRVALQCFINSQKQSRTSLGL